MGQKVSPIGMRLGIIRDWDSKWYANKLEVPYVIVVGEEEEKTGKYALKNMETGEQEVLTIEEIVEKIK